MEFTNIKFVDPEYPQIDISEGVREVLGKEHPAGFILGEGFEIIKVGLRYETRRGNVKEPVKYLICHECPDNDMELVEKVTGMVANFYTRMAKEQPYRKVKDLSVRFVERYATATAS